MAFSDISDSFKHFNVIVAPTEPMVALKVGEQLIRFGDAEEDINIATGRYVASLNLTGLPAISIPCDFSTEGLPIGMQIIGNAYEESNVSRVAHAYEQKAEWHKQYSQIPEFASRSTMTSSDPLRTA
jgi:aspartyl-tRNA(Asn)/glutamyl-tRNA(Gln) amidotransferase subunit A